MAVERPRFAEVKGRGWIVDVDELVFEREPYILELPIEGLFAIRRPVFRDGRGIFQEDCRVPDLEKASGREIKILQSQHSVSHPGTIRGIHAEPQDKIIRPRGQAECVVVDLREGSETFGKWVMLRFKALDPTQPLTSIYIPEGLGNSISATGEGDVVYDYQVTKVYDPKTAGCGIRCDDPDLDIPWSVPVGRRIISERDRNLPTLRQAFPDKFK